MRLIWSPPGGEKQDFIFKPWDVMSPDAEAIELVGGEAWTTYDEFVPLFHKGHRRAMRAALWICRRTAGDDRLRFDDLNLRAGHELKMEQDDEELAALRELVRADLNLDDETKMALLKVYGDDGQADADPKAPPSVPPPMQPDTETGDVNSDG